MRALLACAVSVMILPLTGIARAESSHAHHGQHTPVFAKHTDVAAKPAVQALLHAQPLKVGQSVPVVLTLRNADGSLLTEAQLATAHTRKVHLLVVDSTLVDYQHIHPKPGKSPGEWNFNFTPRKPGAYRVWADVKPVNGAQTYVQAQLGQPSAQPAVPEVVLNDTATVAGVEFKLSFDEPLRAGQAAMGRVDITRAGQPVALAPVMGAFGHIVGFGESGNKVLHVHPMGIEPKTDAERNSGPLVFHVEPGSAGFLKLFVQVHLDGQDLFAPFGLQVKG